MICKVVTGWINCYVGAGTIHQFTLIPPGGIQTGSAYPIWNICKLFKETVNCEKKKTVLLRSGEVFFDIHVEWARGRNQ